MTGLRRNPIDVGGFMRCCIQHYRENAPMSNEAEEGDEMICRWCGSRMVLYTGRWTWDKLVY